MLIESAVRLGTFIIIDLTLLNFLINSRNNLIHGATHLVNIYIRPKHHHIT